MPTVRQEAEHRIAKHTVEGDRYATYRAAEVSLWNDFTKTNEAAYAQVAVAVAELYHNPHSDESHA